MMLTEQAARTKWCPLVRAVNFAPQEGDNPPVNRPTTDFNCIASGCAMWRFRYSGRVAHDVGYCGLADRPEVES